MALARVVKFENATQDNVARSKQDIERGETPEGLPQAEVMLLHNAGDESELAIVVVQNEDDYHRVDDILGSVLRARQPLGASQSPDTRSSRAPQPRKRSAVGGNG